MKDIKDFEPLFTNWYADSFIGSGSFGKVYKITRKEFGATYESALKWISIPQEEYELKQLREEGMDDDSISHYYEALAGKLTNEIQLMSKLRGLSNIVSYEDHTVIPKPNGPGYDIFIRMELLTSLSSYFHDHECTRGDVIRLGIDICSALEQCQRYNIIHRDIKPDNIFWSESGSFKLGDFGIARQLEHTSTELSKKGTYNYMAPEVYKAQQYDSSVDLYSLGIVMYRLLNDGRQPFLPVAPNPMVPNDKEQSLVRRMSGEAMPVPQHAKGRLGEIILKACAYSPKERYSSPKQMREELQAIQFTKEEEGVVFQGEGNLGKIEPSDKNGKVRQEAASNENTDSIFKNAEQPEQEYASNPIGNASEEILLDNHGGTVDIFNPLGNHANTHRNQENESEKERDNKDDGPIIIEEETKIDRRAVFFTISVLILVFAAIFILTYFLRPNGNNKVDNALAVIETSEPTNAFDGTSTLDHTTTGGFIGSAPQTESPDTQTNESREVNSVSQTEPPNVQTEETGDVFAVESALYKAELRFCDCMIEDVWKDDTTASDKADITSGFSLGFAYNPANIATLELRSVGYLMDVKDTTLQGFIAVYDSNGRYVDDSSKNWYDTTNLPDGTYYAVASFAGYEEVKTDLFTIDHSLDTGKAMRIQDLTKISQPERQGFKIYLENKDGTPVQGKSVVVEAISPAGTESMSFTVLRTNEKGIVCDGWDGEEQYVFFLDNSYDLRVQIDNGEWIDITNIPDGV